MNRRAALAAGLLLVATACSADDAAPDSSDTASTPSTSAPTPERADTPDTTDPPTESAPPPATTTPASTVPDGTAPEETAPDPTAAPTSTAAPGVPSAWRPVDAGEYAVGVTTIVLDDPDRPLTVDVWFPLAAEVDTAALDAHRYTLLPTAYYESPTAFSADAAAIAADAFPLVVYSHGSGSIRYLHSSYTEALAAHGHVVVAPDHTGNTIVDRLAGGGAPADQIVFDRPTDVRRVIDAFTDPVAPTAGPFAAAVDAERIAVTGHSFGGYTAVAASTGVATPTGDVPADPRIDAVVPLAPAVGPLLSDGTLESLAVPMMVVVGTDDSTTPVDPNVTRLWDRTATSPAYRVELIAGEHQTFTDLCAYGEFVPTLPDVPEFVVSTIEEFGEAGCSPGDMPADRAAELTNSYVVRFLDEVFRAADPVELAGGAAPEDVVFTSR